MDCIENRDAMLSDLKGMDMDRTICTYLVVTDPEEIGLRSSAIHLSDL